MTSLERPSAARRTMLARMISQYGDVYLRALDWSCWRFFPGKPDSEWA